MLCRNCNKEIGQQPACQYCGFDPALDSGATPVCPRPHAVKPHPVKVKLISTTNGMAVAALVLTFLFPGPIPLLLGFIGLSNSSTTHSGKGMSIFSIIASGLFVAFWVALFAYVFSEAGVY